MILTLLKGWSGLFECIFHISNKTKTTDSKRVVSAQMCLQRLRVFSYIFYICSIYGAHYADVSDGDDIVTYFTFYAYFTFFFLLRLLRRCF